ncbi:MAG TPA: biotin carboxylase N-terminal domain-containing protein [Thermomicrobiales bacterium]|nr:biotin carboxylase N-terminal domain-containing protein [Thermomicrobiales bacterium]
MTEGNIRRVLVANRGEIAIRIMRACREMGIASVAVYGDGEERAPHVRYADDAWRIPDGPGLPYLRIEGLIDVAKRAGADAVHPGYGFLAENAAFARATVEAGLVFIGPPAEAIAAMGNKVEARRIATGAGVSPVPGTPGPVASAEEARAWADAHGYPVAVKASGGGGGRGFRVARDASEIEAAFAGSRGEAERYFANPEVYLERYLEQPRHIEVQVFADAHGGVVAFPERDCSIQRRHQKLVEESPSPAVDAALRERFQAATGALVRAVDYRGAGTVEYLLDRGGEFFFLEMNTRIQVEHTITEMVTGIDLIREQIRVASGAPLSFGAADVTPRGWAIECRINAEDASRQFAPVAGTITRDREPAGFGVRVDGALREGDQILPAYDSMIAKLIVWGRDRDEAISRMRRALADYEIGGVPTTIPFHQRVMAHPAFVAGEATTTFLVDHPDVLEIAAASQEEASAAADGAVDERTRLIVEVGGRRFDVAVAGLASVATTNGRSRAKRSGRPRAASAAAAGNALVSPIQGTVLRVAVEPGQAVAAGDLICVVEAMKMENELTAHRDGVVTEVGVAAGGTVQIGTVVATIEDAG